MNQKYTFLIGPLIFFVIWYLVSVLQLVDALFLPSPTKVLLSLYDLFFTKCDIYMPLFSSARRMFVGFFIGVISGVPLGLLLGSSQFLYSSCEILIDFFRSIPSTSFFPFFMLILGVGDGPKIAVVAFGCFFVCVINTSFGVVHSSPSRLFVAKIMGAPKGYLFFKVRFFEALPNISSGIKISISYAIVLVVVSEMFIGTDIGLGRLIYDSHYSYQIDRMFAVIVATGALGYFSNKLFSMLENRLLHWSGKSN
ncbi:MAG: ABC transporter permease [Desulfobacteraceae bacterium]|nr:ABC transporter permease [Desulfobacteraceae bacterium]